MHSQKMTKTTANTLYCEGKLRATTYQFEGKCRSCGAKFKLKSIYPNECTCLECHYHIKHPKSGGNW